MPEPSRFIVPTWAVVARSYSSLNCFEPMLYVSRERPHAAARPRLRARAPERGGQRQRHEPQGGNDLLVSHGGIIEQERGHGEPVNRPPLSRSLHPKWAVARLCCATPRTPDFHEVFAARRLYWFEII